MADNTPGTPPRHDEAGRIVIIIVGVALVLFGLGMLARQWLWPYVPLEEVWRIVRGAGWGLGLVIIGVIAIIWSQRPGFKAPEKGARIYRSRANRMVSGVMGGLAEYLSVDVTLLRLAFVALGLMFGVWPAIVAYVAATIIVPEAPIGSPVTEYASQAPPPPPPPPPTAVPAEPPADPAAPSAEPPAGESS